MFDGSNSVAGVYTGGDSLAMDWLFPFVFYGYTTSGQLIIYNALLSPFADKNAPNVMVVEDYDFGGWKDDQWGRPKAGDLGMTFRIVTREPGAKEISIWNFVWGARAANDNALPAGASCPTVAAISARAMSTVAA